MISKIQKHAKTRFKACEHKNVAFVSQSLVESRKKYIENMQSMCNYKSILVQEIYGRHINEGNAINSIFCQKIHCMNGVARQLEI